MNSKRPHSPVAAPERPLKMVVTESEAVVTESEAVVTEAVDTSNSLFVKRVSERGRLPTRGSPLAAGYDLHRLVLDNRREFM